MIKVRIEIDDMLVELKDSHCDATQDNADLLWSALKSVVFDVDEEVEQDDVIYIEQDQPKDHIQHEGM